MGYDKHFFRDCYELFSSVCPANSRVLVKNAITVLLSSDISRMGYLRNRLYEGNGFVILGGLSFLFLFFFFFFFFFWGGGVWCGANYLL